MQYSVFLIDAKPAKLLRMKAAARAELDPADSLLIADLGPVIDGTNDRIEFVGARRRFTGDGPLVF